MNSHAYETTIDWTGNRGPGTRDYRSYDRSYSVAAPGKETFAGSADPAFLGAADLYNPEELLVAAVSACHMLWYLHLCAVNKVVVIAYRDRATATMTLGADGIGAIDAATLNPMVTIGSGDAGMARRLHDEAHTKCFIARSVKFPIECRPTILTDA
ncbi:OsmC family protein [Fodinicurvata sp. EGI_FJ10296]|uniref:OsmC family protein n=1 Tax=Fodinicurvata sp. EGI_FJ10296 TaxID=3231908 RepID=UPI003454475C